MSQAARILTREQRLALEAVYAFIRGTTIYLEAIVPVVRDADERQVKSLTELGVLCQTRLLEQFPEVRDFALGGGAR